MEKKEPLLSLQWKLNNWLLFLYKLKYKNIYFSGDNMLKKMSIKKIIVSTTAIILLLVIYLIPSNRKDIDLKNNSIEYNYNNVESTIYLVDSNDYVANNYTHM